MRVCFLGNSHAPHHLAVAAAARGFEVVREMAGAELVFVSQDTPTDHLGNRDMAPIRELARRALAGAAPVVLSSQCEPGFTRSLGAELYHHADTLRLKDAAERALYPEMMIVGSRDPEAPLPSPYRIYLEAFDCPILRMTWEEAEFAKVAINVSLAAQVENTNRLAAAAGRCGARWERIAQVLRHDSRIGPRAYLVPGRWQDSSHLLRDHLTVRHIMGEA